MAANAEASQFKGYGKSPNGETLTLNETIDRITETQHDFLVLISRHAALYRFPKFDEYAGQVREFLQSRSKNRKAVVFQIDPTTARILYVSDP
jgi:hypothetical protein